MMDDRRAQLENAVREAALALLDYTKSEAFYLPIKGDLIVAGGNWMSIEIMCGRDGDEYCAAYEGKD